MGLGFYKIVGPDMVAALRPQPDAGAVIQPQTATWLLFPGYFQPLTTPDALDPVGTHIPARFVEHVGDPPIAIAPILRCQRQNGLCQPVLIGTGNDRVTLRATGLADDPAGLAFGELVFLPDPLDSLPAPFGA